MTSHQFVEDCLPNAHPDCWHASIPTDPAEIIAKGIRGCLMPDNCSELWTDHDPNIAWLSNWHGNEVMLQKVIAAQRLTDACGCHSVGGELQQYWQPGKTQLLMFETMLAVHDDGLLLSQLLQRGFLINPFFIELMVTRSSIQCLEVAFTHPSWETNQIMQHSEYLLSLTFSTILFKTLHGKPVRRKYGVLKTILPYANLDCFLGENSTVHQMIRNKGAESEGDRTVLTDLVHLLESSNQYQVQFLVNTIFNPMIKK